MFWIKDAGFQRACFQVYNDWLAEFCSHAPKRLKGLGLISLYDPKQAATDLADCAKKGLAGAIIWASPPEELPFHSETYDPFWAAAQDLEMPISLHVITQRKQREIKFRFDRPKEEGAGDAKAGGAAAGAKEDGATASPFPAVDPIFEIQQSIRSLIYGGALERFPKLKIVSAENDAGWVAHYLHRLDHGHEKLFGKQPGGRLKKMPSDYLREHLWATFQDDPVAPLTCSYFGEDQFMWASDFPHTDSTWPHSQEVIARDFAQVSEAVRRKIVSENAIKLYRMDLN